MRSDLAQGLSKSPFTRGFTYNKPPITTDAHDGLIQAIQEEYPLSDWQHCIAHWTRNLRKAALKRDRPPIAGWGSLSERIRGEVWEAPNREVAHKMAMEIYHEYPSFAPRTMRIFQKGWVAPDYDSPSPR
nr:transposase [Pasteuria penetrans]